MKLSKYFTKEEIQLIKSWALEVVGENKKPTLKDWKEGHKTADELWERYRTKEEIIKSISEN